MPLWKTEARPDVPLRAATASEPLENVCDSCLEKRPYGRVNVFRARRNDKERTHSLNKMVKNPIVGGVIEQSEKYFLSTRTARKRGKAVRKSPGWTSTAGPMRRRYFTLTSIPGSTYQRV
jgi:hypothetical protein